jgi:hypothetical protein
MVNECSKSSENATLIPFLAEVRLIVYLHKAFRNREKPDAQLALPTTPAT